MGRIGIWVAVGIALLVVGISIIVSFVSIGSSAPASSGTSSNPWFWVVVIALVVIAGIYLFAGRGGWGGGLAVGLVVLLLAIKLISGIFFGDRAPEVEKAFQKGAAESVLSDGSSRGMKAGPVAKQETAKWSETAKDGTLPVGIWSLPMRPETGCTLKFSAGNGTVYRVQTRIDGMKDWKDHIPRTNVGGDEARYQVLVPGVTVLPIRVVC